MGTGAEASYLGKNILPQQGSAPPNFPSRDLYPIEVVAFHPLVLTILPSNNFKS